MFGGLVPLGGAKEADEVCYLEIEDPSFPKDLLSDLSGNSWSGIIFDGL